MLGNIESTIVYDAPNIVDGFFYIVRQNISKRDEVVVTIKNLENTGLKNLGVILVGE